MKHPKILLVDDDVRFCKILARVLGNEGHDVTCVHRAADAMAAVRENLWDLVLLDMVLPDGNGIECLGKVHAISPELAVVVVTANGSIRDAVAAVKSGAQDYITKPFDNQHLSIVVARALEHSRMRSELSMLRHQVESSDHLRGRLKGHSPAMRKVMEMVRLVAPTDVTVLIVGESGTGKELLARTLHEKSRRADKPFIAVDCATLPASLIESALFGHVKGSFTDARESRRGKFEAAQGGTLFLDEIGNLSLQVQAKLLRVLQERTFERVGDTRTIQLNVRIVTATNVNLPEALRTGRFREDLYHRLNEFRIHSPPLRERRNDVLLLAQMFVEEFAGLFEKSKVPRISDEAARLILSYRWPGNVRQLRNEMKRAVLMCAGDTIQSVRLSTELRMPAYRDGDSNGQSIDLSAFQGLTLKEASGRARNAVERHLIQIILAQTGGRKGETASRLGVDAKTLYNKMKEYGIPEPGPAHPTKQTRAT